MALSLPATLAKRAPALFGLIFNSQDVGIPGLIVRVTPADRSVPPSYASTDNRGAFAFATPTIRFYILDVIRSDRRTLLHRSSVDLQEQKRVVIKLYQVEQEAKQWCVTCSWKTTMSSSEYVFLIDIICDIAGATVLVPLLLYLFRPWATRRDKLFSYLDPASLMLYYRQFYPDTKPALASVQNDFRKYFNKHYGRRHYLLPI
jgi:hypothetical protein